VSISRRFTEIRLSQPHGKAATVKVRRMRE
jgi:hypothetical protein